MTIYPGLWWYSSTGPTDDQVQAAIARHKERNDMIAEVILVCPKLKHNGTICGLRVIENHYISSIEHFMVCSKKINAGGAEPGVG